MTEKSSIRLRPAEPTRVDGLAFARYLDEAAEGFFRFMLGSRSNEIIATAFTQPDHDLSYQNVTFAERDGKVVGMASGFSAEQHRRSTLAPLKQAAGRGHLRMRIVLVTFAPLLRIIDSIADSEYYLQALAVDETYRGEGIGVRLMRQVEARARDRGAMKLFLDVSAKNTNAREFYERYGMTIESQWPTHIPITALKFYRMTKSI